MAEDEKGQSKGMKPWEQHAAVISIPRFDYTAPSSLLHHSHSGFLITCPIKREKSATKEAIVILEKHIGSYDHPSESSDAGEISKRRKLSSLEGECIATTEGELLKDECLSSEKTYDHVVQKPALLLVKLTRSGLLLFTFPRENSLDPVGTVSNVHQSLESGRLKRPLWCHRIFPIQATCKLNEKEVGSTVSNLVLKVVTDRADKLSKPIKFAIGYNRRGIEETELKSLKDSHSDPDLCSMLDRNKCFSVVATAINAVISDSAVDLKSPQMCVLIELLPVSGVPSESLVVAISVLPRELVSTKPRLCVKALVSNQKPGKEGS